MPKTYRYVCKKCGHKSNSCEVAANADVGYTSTGKGMRNLVLVTVYNELRFCLKCERQLYA